MNHEEYTSTGVLACIGISITRRTSPRDGWGWSMENDKITHGWDGPYCTAEEAMRAALCWLLENARKGLLCNSLHSAASAAGSLPLEVICFGEEWWRRLN